MTQALEPISAWPVAACGSPAFPRRRHYVVIALIFIGLAIYGSLVPLRYTSIEFDTAVQRFRELPYFQLGIQSRSDWVSNVLLFIPISFLLMASCLVDRPGLARKMAFVPLVLAGCAALSISIEFTQIWFPPRTVSQNDIIAESLGGLIGVVLWLWSGTRLNRSIRSFLAMRGSADQLDWLLRAYLVGLLVYSVLPFDLTVRPAEVWDKYQEGKITLIPFSYPYESSYRAIYAFVATVLAFVPAGMLIARTPVTAGHRVRSVAASVVWGFLLAAGVETAQLFVYSRTTNTTDLITGTIGTAIGVWVIQRWPASDEPSFSNERRRADSWFVYLGVSLLSAAVLPLVFWTPYDFITDGALIRERLNGLFQVPFSALYFGSDFNAMVQITRKTLWYVPLGGLLAAAAKAAVLPLAIRRMFLAAALLTVSAVAVGIELGKVLVPSRTPDFTNVIFATLGGAAGMFLATRFVKSDDDQGFRLPDQPVERVEPSLFYVPGLDGLRAIACLAVFGVHLHQLTGVSGFYGPFEVSRFLENGNHGVALFFIVSGFLLGLPWWYGREPKPNPRWLKSYGLKRIARIAPPYFLCLTILVLKGRHWETPLERLDTVLHYLFLHSYAEFSIYSLNSPFWTLAIQAQFYLIFPVVLLLVHRVAQRQGHRLAVWLALLVGCFAIHYSVMSYISGITSWPLDARWVLQDGFVLTHSILAHVPLFLLGVSAGYGFWRLSRVSAPHAKTLQIFCEIAFWASAAVVLTILSTQLDPLAQIPFGRYHFPLVPCLIAIMVLSVAYTRWARAILESRPLRTLGVISFGVYVYHLPCLNLVSRGMGLLGRDPGANWLLLGVLGLLTSIVVAAGSYVVIERPLLRLSKRWPPGRTPEPSELVRPREWETTI